jgi:peptide/nickel transport system ATP-binding protein/oligopeptide transport system ATP-binding protein
MSMPPVLAVEKLSTWFDTEQGPLKAVDEVSFQLKAGETLGIVGESGCGKTVLSLSIMRLVPTPPGRYVSGRIEMGGADLLSLSEKEMRKVRGKDISMIFQEPMTSLNPVFRIGAQISETIRLHQGSNRTESNQKAIEMLRLVGIDVPEQRINDYPHQLSGGMRQRIMIAMALACHPQLMLADEPTTALDVTIQAQILALINNLKKDMGTSVILITHDLGVIAENAQQVAIMYAGKFVEYADVKDLFAHPQHPYTEGLLHSIPRIEGHYDRNNRLPILPGGVPNLSRLPAGCSFHDRCPYVMNICRDKEPVLVGQDFTRRYVRCWKYQ